MRPPASGRSSAPRAMPLSQMQKSLIERARSVGSSEMAVPISDAAGVYLLVRTVRDLGLQARYAEIPEDVQPFYETAPVSSLALDGLSFDALAENLFNSTPDAGAAEGTSEVRTHPKAAAVSHHGSSRAARASPIRYASLACTGGAAVLAQMVLRHRQSRLQTLPAALIDSQAVDRTAVHCQDALGCPRRASRASSGLWNRLGRVAGRHRSR